MNYPGKCFNDQVDYICELCAWLDIGGNVYDHEKDTCIYDNLVGAGKAYGGESDAKEYYLKNQHKWCLHPDTKTKFEKLLGIGEGDKL